jgi:hypothetical protein
MKNEVVSLGSMTLATHRARSYADLGCLKINAIDAAIAPK